MLDIKLKNNHKVRISLSIVSIFLVTILTMCFFPAIHQEAQSKLEKREETGEVQDEEYINQDLLRELYRGCYVLYKEAAAYDGAQNASDVYLEISYEGKNEEQLALVESVKEYVENEWEALSNYFESYRSQIDYCIELGEAGTLTNTSQPLTALLGERKTTSQTTRLREYYNAYFKVQFDENGMFSVEPLYNSSVNSDVLMKSMQQIAREEDVWANLNTEYEGYDMEYRIKSPANFSVVFAIPKTSNYQLTEEDYEAGADYWVLMSVYREAGAELLYIVALAVLVILAFVMTSSKIWKCEISMKRSGKWYLLEVAWIAVFCVIAFVDSFNQMIWSFDIHTGYDGLFDRLASGEVLGVAGDILSMAIPIFLLYAIWYAAVLFIRPMFTLGVKEYIREYSLCYQLLPFMRSVRDKLMDETRHIDFSEKSVKTIMKLAAVNFVIVSLCAMGWFFGIPFLLIYSVGLFIFMNRYYKDAEKDYQTLRRGVAQIAEGDLDTEITEDLGMFEPIKEDLGKVRTGFKKAVDEEVKSQRMKAELITNVSHDLKTPLTAITTYVELLKKEDITEEERNSYIETLERKSLRLKVLIEDLFEVSKATSNNIVLNYMDVDVVNLLKQVSVEHADKFAEMGLDLRWSVPEEKVVVQLDNQKTYRIFENLFVNIRKYAMPNSRVYIEVTQEEKQVRVVLKNMSANELNISADEITERFVRGDASRNTEGSGLGLAIAKSFTEAQGGSFAVDVDGDLFKVVIGFKR